MKNEKIFLAIVFPLAYILSILFLIKGLSNALTIIMMLPALAATISILIEFRSFTKLLPPFFQRISLRSLTFSILFPIIIILLCLELVSLTKQGALIASWSYIFTKIGSLILVSIVFFIIGLCEEYGWRGYFFPKLIEKFNIRKATFITGIVVACYHIPVVFILNMHYGIFKALVYTLIQSGSIFAMNYSFTYLFTLSQNVILPSIMRTLWSCLNLAILGYSYNLIPSYGCVIGKPHIINGEGIFGLIFMGFFAAYAYRKFSKSTT